MRTVTGQQFQKVLLHVIFEEYRKKITNLTYVLNIILLKKYFEHGLNHVYFLGH